MSVMAPHAKSTAIPANSTTSQASFLLEFVPLPNACQPPHIIRPIAAATLTRSHQKRFVCRRNAVSAGPMWLDIVQMAEIVAIGYKRATSKQQSRAGAVQSGAGVF